MKKAFTLIELIFSIIILAILSTGTLVAVKHLYVREAKSKAISDLSSDSQAISDQISALLYNRVPNATIGYKSSNGDFQSIYNIEDTQYNILEWIGTANESFKSGYYSGFIDMDASNKDINTTVSFELNKTGIDNILKAKFLGNNNIQNNGIDLIFAGSFDEGTSSSDFNNSFGWHNNEHNITYDINISDNNITFGTKGPNNIYEKYYFADSAYAVAMGSEINDSAICIKDLNISNINSTLFLFYNYRPWKNETFCADKQGVNKDGNVTILSTDARGFEAGLVDGNIYFNLTLQKVIRGSDNNVTISKQKVVF